MVSDRQWNTFHHLHWLVLCVLWIVDNNEHNKKFELSRDQARALIDKPDWIRKGGLLQRLLPSFIHPSPQILSTLNFIKQYNTNSRLAPSIFLFIGYLRLYYPFQSNVNNPTAKNPSASNRLQPQLLTLSNLNRSDKMSSDQQFIHLKSSDGVEMKVGMYYCHGSPHTLNSC